MLFWWDQRMLGPNRGPLSHDEAGDDHDGTPLAMLYSLSYADEEELIRFPGNLGWATADQKHREVEHIPFDCTGGTRTWLNLGCIIFRQYVDTESIAWETCSRVLDAQTQLNPLMISWR